MLVIRKSSKAARAMKVIEITVRHLWTGDLLVQRYTVPMAVNADAWQTVQWQADGMCNTTHRLVSVTEEW